MHKGLFWWSLSGVAVMAAFAHAAPPGMVTDTDATRPRVAALDLQAAGLFRLSDGSVVARLQCAGKFRPENVRLTLDLSGRAPSAEAPPTRLIEGTVCYRRPDDATGWAWDETGGAAWLQFEGESGGEIFYLLPERTEAERVRWAVETVDEQWQTVDRMPEAGMLTARVAELPELTAPPPAIAADLREIVTNAPAALSPRVRKDLEAYPWEQHAAGAEAGRLAAPFLPQPVPLRVRMRDARTGGEAELKPGRTWIDGDRARWTGEAMDVAWSLMFEKTGEGAVRVTAEFEAKNERCLQVEIACDLPEGPWLWHDDVLTARAAGAAGGRLACTRPWPYGLAREISVHPFGVVSCGEGALMAETPPGEPRSFVIALDPATRRFGLTCDLGLSPLTARFPGRAAVECAFRPLALAGAPVFRAALADWYTRHPAPSRVAADAWVEEWPVRPWLLWLPFPAGAERSETEALRLLRFQGACGRAGAGLDAQAALLSGARRADGAYAIDFGDLLLRDAARLGLGVDPEIMTTATAPANRAGIEWDRIRRVLDAGGTAVRLEDLDKLQGLDFNRAALAVADYPCVFVAGDLQPGLAVPIAACEFIHPLASALRKRGAATSAALRGLPVPFHLPALDRLSVEPIEAEGELRRRELAALRALAGARPVSLGRPAARGAETAAAARAFLDDCLTWGFLPAPRALPDSAGSLLESYGPLLARLAAAGWEPWGPGAAVTTGLQVECFGRAESTVRHFAVRNLASTSAVAEVEITGVQDPVAILTPLTAACDVARPREGRVVARLPLAAGEAGAFDVFRLSQAAVEEQFLQAWRPVTGEAEAALKNLRSARREFEAGLACRIQTAAPAIRGTRNSLVARMANEASENMVISEATLQFAGARRSLGGEPRILAPGESIEYTGYFAEEDLAGAPWMEVRWRAQKGSQDWTGARMIRPVFVSPVQVESLAPALSCAGDSIAVGWRLRNPSRVPREVELRWDGDFTAGSDKLTLQAGEAREYRTAVRGRAGMSGAVRLTASSGAAFENALSRVTFLGPDDSLARDSAVGIEGGRSEPGFRVAALTDGAIGPAAEAWASEASAGAHRLRLVFPSPVRASVVRLHWPLRDGRGQAARQGAVSILPAGGEPLRIGAFDGRGAVSSFPFEAREISGIEVAQEAHGGAPITPDRLWLTEIEVR